MAPSWLFARMNRKKIRIKFDAEQLTDGIYYVQVRKNYGKSAISFWTKRFGQHAELAWP